MKNFRLGLNVAECDARPLVVCLATDKTEMEAMQNKLSPISFSNELCGRFNYASVNDPEELKTIAGDKPESGYVVSPLVNSGPMEISKSPWPPMHPPQRFQNS